MRKMSYKKLQTMISVSLCFVGVFIVSGVQAQLPPNAFLLPESPYEVATGPTAIDVADLDNDGHPDLATADTDDDTVSVLFNNGDGTFTAIAGALNVQQEPVAIIAADFNNGGGGIRDLAIVNQTSESVSIILNNGNGTFSPPTHIPNVGDKPVALAARNLDGASGLDLIVVNQASGLAVLFNNGSGGFDTPVPVSVGQGGTCCTIRQAIATANLDGVNRADAAVAWVGTPSNEDHRDAVAMVLNDGSGTLAEVEGQRKSLPVEDDSCAADPECHSLAITAADLDGDGDTDLAVAVSDYTDSDDTDPLHRPNTVFVLLNRGRNTSSWLGFANAIPYPLALGADPRGITAADLNHDGAPELIVANRGHNTVSVLVNSGEGTFPVRRDFPLRGLGLSAVAAADFDGDGDNDVATANSVSDTVSVLIYQPMFLASIGDVNSNGFADVAVLVSVPATEQNFVYIYDGGTGALLRKQGALFGYTPADFAFIPGLNSSATGGLVVLGVRNSTGAVQGQVRRVPDGSLVRNVIFLKSYRPQALAIVPHFPGNITDELAVLGTAADGKVRVQVRDAVNGSSLQNVQFAPTFMPQALTVVSSFGGSAEAGLAVLGVRGSDGLIRAQIKNAMSGAFLSNVSFGTNKAPYDFVTVPDFGDLDADELALLWVHANGNVWVDVRDAKSGGLLERLRFRSAFSPHDLATVPHFASTAAAELAVLGKSVNTGSVRVEIKNASNDVQVADEIFNNNLLPQALAVLPVTSNHGPAVAVLAVHALTGKTQVRIQEIQGGHTLIITIP